MVTREPAIRRLRTSRPYSSVPSRWAAPGPPSRCAGSTASGSAASADVQHAVAGIRRAIEASLRARIERDIDGGLLLRGTQAAALSGLVMAVTQGLSALARDGGTRPSLLAVVEAALQGWPHGQETGAA